MAHSEKLIALKDKHYTRMTLAMLVTAVMMFLIYFTAPDATIYGCLQWDARSTQARMVNVVRPPNISLPTVLTYRFETFDGRQIEVTRYKSLHEEQRYTPGQSYPVQYCGAYPHAVSLEDRIKWRRRPAIIALWSLLIGVMAVGVIVYSLNALTRIALNPHRY